MICSISELSRSPIAHCIGRLVCHAPSRRRGLLFSFLLFSHGSPILGQVTREQRPPNHRQVLSVLVPKFSDRLDNYSGVGTEFALAVEAALVQDSAFSLVSWSTLVTQLRAAARTPRDRDIPAADSTSMDYRLRRAPCLIGRQMAVRLDIDMVICGSVKPTDSVYRVDVSIIQVDAGTHTVVGPIYGMTPADLAEVVMHALNASP